jgi:hypothetical protein
MDEEMITHVMFRRLQKAGEDFVLGDETLYIEIQEVRGRLEIKETGLVTNPGIHQSESEGHHVETRSESGSEGDDEDVESRSGYVDWESGVDITGRLRPVPQ